MKPNFALDLRNDTITLLHRAGSGWDVIGATEFGAPDMDAMLARMRADALNLSPQGIATKLIIPNDQILYTSLHAPGPGKAARRAQIRDALVGRTPYDVDALAYDWAEPVPDGAENLVVAVIARETLAEAEGFVAAHGLNPIGFTAVPDDPAFGREPWFGASSIAAEILPAGAKVEGDSAPVRINEAQALPEPAAEPPMDAVEPEPVPTAPADPLPHSEDPPEPEVDLSVLNAPSAFADETAFPAADALARVQDEAAQDATPEPEPEPEPEPVLAPAPAVEPENASKVPPTLPDWLADKTAPQAATTKRDVAAAEFVAPARDSAASSRRWFEDVEEAPMALDVEAEDQTPDPTDPKTSVAPGTAASIELADDLPPAPAAPILESFASRRVGGGSGATIPPASPALSGAQRPGLAAPPKPAKGLRSLVTAPGIAGFRSKPKAADPKRTDAKRIVTIKPEARPTAVTTAARPGQAGEGSFVAGRIGQRERGRPAYLLLVLTVALLIAMALVAAWSSYLAMRGNEPAGATAIATVSDPEPTLTPAPAPEPAQTVATQEPAAPTELSGNPPATGDVGIAPAIGQAETGVAGEIQVAKQEPPAVLPDPLAQPTVAALAAGPPPTPDTPPPFGTVLEFDAAGLIKPTPEGIETPEGVFLLAGKPPVLPPRRTPTAEAAALAAKTAAAPPLPAVTGSDPATALVPADPALAKARPQPRPENLAPPSLDDTGLAPLPGQPVQIVLRPKARPAAVLAASAALRDAATPGADASLAAGAVAEGGLIATAPTVQISANTVTISRVPAPRPRDLERAVEAAVAAALQPSAPAAPEPEQSAPEPTPEPVVAAPAAKPQVGKPDDVVEEEPEVASSAPSAASKGAVAKNATFRNAIDLGETNLIGIYGTESRRYAMVRTGSGGYKKVKVGDRVDGGKVAAITTKELRLQKGGSMKVLKIPGG